ncbi:MAG: c-type cytochrome [Rhizobiaceae bacterium]|nr:c-type cytochrome [Rhizobiaceae bacterium]
MRLIKNYSIPMGILTILIASTGISSFAAAQSSGNATAGEKIFKKCAGCHKVGANAKNSTGPVLNNVVGRAAGSYPGYRYGKGMKAANAKGLVWNEARIFDYLGDPKKYLRTYLGDKKAKAKMRFKLKNADDRRNVVAYLVKISSAGNSSLDEKNEDETTSVPANAELPSHEAMKNQICVQNNFPKLLLLTAEATDGERQIKTVGQSGFLCVDNGMTTSGTVGVFENEDALEGCSRLARTGKTEVLIAYASFDNCRWKE